MYRAIAVPRQTPRSTGRSLVRATRRRLTTTPPAEPIPEPKKTKSVVRKFLFYSVAGTSAFYIGSTFASYESPQYREFFSQNVPLGEALVEYGAKHGWDEITIQNIVISTVDAVKYVSDFVQKQLGYRPSEDAATKDTPKEAAQPVRERAKDAHQESKGRVKSLATALKTSVERSDDHGTPEARKPTATARYMAVKFAEELEDLIRKAEEALEKKYPELEPEVTAAVDQPKATEVELVIVPESKDKNVYEVPLPIGFEPPPGYVRPRPQKPKDTASPPTEPVPTPLPLVAPAVSDVAVSEPVVSHLAHTIDNLASYLNSAPAAAEKAKDVLETAKVDLRDLASRIERIKEEEQHQLEQKLDEQAREYNTKLLELEIEAQDKLDLQQEDFRKFVEEERVKYAQAYREKLANELKTQTELINERLKEEVIAQGIEMQRRWIREVKVKVEEERGGRLARLEELATNLKRLERLALDNSSYLDENIRVHALWTAVRAMQTAVDASVRKPFREELRVLRHVAVAKDDPVLSTALDSIEKTDIPDVGVEPLVDLTSWFTTSVAPRVSSVALVPDRNAGVLSHLASHLLTSFTFRKHGLTPGNDVLSVLARAEYYLNEKDLDSATRELNQLTGTAKELLHDWLEAARRRLEVQQALEVIQVEATLASLLVV
ncbi:mitochondrial inner membrane protein Mitofilin [Pisolithus orientalis]|uniref:mitochondrial inner membrane protein Mitofilin n=1 Tax=Pisolithus orientalis TaxID=936130 RepID=UPI0022255239|nr:mitochondrial inner membrane protein Mitofilin [Pisolithus orientalis]KAI6006621.1 mitochondrial inner membrane protein Mitofilin [Pisolithus orientalis]